MQVIFFLRQRLQRAPQISESVLPLMTGLPCGSNNITKVTVISCFLVLIPYKCCHLHALTIPSLPSHRLPIAAQGLCVRCHLHRVLGHAWYAL